MARSEGVLVGAALISERHIESWHVERARILPRAGPLRREMQRPKAG